MLTLFELFGSAFFFSFSFFIWERRSHTSFLKGVGKPLLWKRRSHTSFFSTTPLARYYQHWKLHTLQHRKPQHALFSNMTGQNASTSMSFSKKHFCVDVTVMRNPTASRQASIESCKKYSCVIVDTTSLVGNKRMATSELFVENQGALGARGSRQHIVKTK